MQATLYEEMISYLVNRQRTPFEAKFNKLYFFGTLPEGAAKDNTPLFNTNITEPKQRREVSKNLSMADQCQFVFELKKKVNNLWCNWISVGRSNNNDIVIRYKNVSKLHGRIEVENSLRGVPMTYTLYDNNSTCGTKVNGIQLKKAQGSILRPGDRICFGPVECRLLDGERLKKLLKRTLA